MNRFTILLALLVLVVSTIAASPPSFCKCTCFTNSTIIALSTHALPQPNPNTPQSPSSPPRTGSTCATCNKAFCLSQRLPICKDAEEKDVLTTCFQRDSRKDQIVVLTFIAGTIGLLGWAGVRRCLESRGRGEGLRIGDAAVGSYAPVGGR